MPRSRRLRGRSRPRSAPPAPRSTGAGARPPLPPGPRRTGGSGRPVGGWWGGHTQTGWVLPAGPCSAAFPRRWQPEPVIIPRLLIIYPLPRPPAGRTQEPAVGDLEALPLSPPARGGPRGLDARSPCRAPPPPGRGSPAPAPFAAPRRAARHRRPLPGLDGGRHVGGPQGAGGCGSAPAPSAVPRPFPLPARLRSPQGSVPARPRSPHRSRPRPPRQRGAPGRGSSAPAPPLRPLSPPAPRSSPYLLTVELTAVFVS